MSERDIELNKRRAAYRMKKKNSSRERKITKEEKSVRKGSVSGKLRENGPDGNAPQRSR